MPVAVFDLDGTLFEYHKFLAVFVCNYWNLSEKELVEAITWRGEGKWHEKFGITQEQYRQAKLAFRQGGNKRLMKEFFDGGLELVSELSNYGCDIWYATTRPWQSLNNIDPDTRWRIETAGLPINGILYDEDKYRKLVTECVDPDRIIIVVDDLPEQYDAATALGLPVVQVARQHNSGPTVKRPTRLTMTGVRQLALDNLTEWNATHE